MYPLFHRKINCVSLSSILRLHWVQISLKSVKPCWQENHFIIQMGLLLHLIQSLFQKKAGNDLINNSNGNLPKTVQLISSLHLKKRMGHKMIKYQQQLIPILAFLFSLKQCDYMLAPLKIRIFVKPC